MTQTLKYEPVLGKDPVLIPISNSEIGTYKECRRKWWLAYYLGLGPRERSAVGPLAFGTRMHKCLEEFYKNGVDPAQTNSELIAEDKAELIAAGIDIAPLEKDAELGRIMMEGYMEWLEETGADSDIEVTDSEKKLSFPLFNGKVEVRGKLDLRIKNRQDNSRQILDFKTLASYDTYLKTAHMAEQLKLYMLLETMNKVEGERVDGAKYRLLKKVKRSAKAKPPFFMDVDIRHNKKTLESYWYSLHGVVQNMLDLRKQLDDGADPRQVAYPTPTNDCTWKCFTGDTEVITRQGIKKMKDLVGTSPELLIPVRYNNMSFTSDGVWENHEIQSFGSQEIYDLHVRKGRQTRVIRTTKDHLWWVDRGSHRVETQNLQTGTVLPEARRSSYKNIKEIPPAVAQGFVFGDGTNMGKGVNGMLDVYDPKDVFIFDYFALHPQKVVNRTTKIHEKVYKTKCTRIHQIPERWKSLPLLEENASFLGSWLAGYFAADGTVSKVGAATIHSAKIENIKFVRDVCSLVGIPHGTILKNERLGTGKEKSLIYKMSLDSRRMPLWMFLNKEHKKRVEQKLLRKTKNLQWKVEKVINTKIKESVFCAVVPNKEAFVLVDSIVTSNCPFYTACPMFDDGSAVADYIDDNFEQYDPYARYEEEEK